MGKKRARGRGELVYQVPASREGKRFIGGYYDPEVARELKVIAARDDSTIQELVGRAIERFLIDQGIRRKVVEQAGDRH